MASCCSSSRSTQLVQLASTPNDSQDADDDIEFEKRILQLEEIENRPPYRLALKDWTEELEASERKLERKLANWSRSRSDLYQILDLFFVFQGVILTAVAQSSLLHCNNWALVFALSLIASLAAIGASVQKLMEIAEYQEQQLVEKKLYSSLRTTIDNLKEKGKNFDLKADQPELGEGYTKEDYSGKGNFTRRCAALTSFYRVWVCSYAGCVLLLLFAFSGITLTAVLRILCP